MAALLFCLPPLTWTATGLLAGWLAARRGKSWYRGFALGFFFSTAGLVLAALPRGSSPARLATGVEPSPTPTTSTGRQYGFDEVPRDPLFGAGSRVSSLRKRPRPSRHRQCLRGLYSGWSRGSAIECTSALRRAGES